MPLRLLAVVRSAATWMASSRVGTTTRARGCLGVPGAVCERWSSGRPKARVLPVPVRACPMMSLPLSAIGSASSWMGKGSTIPSASRASASSVLTPRSRNVVDVVGTSVLVRAQASILRGPGIGVAAAGCGRERLLAVAEGAAHRLPAPCGSSRRRCRLDRRGARGTRPRIGSIRCSVVCEGTGHGERGGAVPAVAGCRALTVSAAIPDGAPHTPVITVSLAGDAWCGHSSSSGCGRRGSTRSQTVQPLGCDE